MKPPPPPDPPQEPRPDSVWPATAAPAASPDGPLSLVPDDPPAARPAVADLLALTRRLGLLDGERLAEAERLAAGLGAEALGRELLRRGWLTALQANRLLQGQGGSLLVGGHVLLERLGAGGMGMVFKARHARLGRVVALKLIHRDHLASPEAARRFVREAQATSRLDHPNVVRALDAGRDGPTHYLVLELVEGTDLARLLAQGGVPPVAVACEYVRQAALGLQHAFEQGLVHRDVKPSNLMLLPGPPPLVKLLDLGLSRPEPGAASDGTSLTETGAVMGTPDYMAPEQVRDSKRADIRSDLYSLGCTLYHLLAGRPPFGGGTVALKLVQHQMEEPEAVESLRPEVPAAVATIVRKLMAKSPEDRYQTPGEVAGVLASVLQAANWSPAGAFTGIAGDATDVVDPPSLARRLRADWSARRLAAAGALAALLLASAGGALWRLSRPPPVPVAPPAPDYALDRLSEAKIALDERFRAWQPAELVQVLGEHKGRHWNGVGALAFSPDGSVVYSAGNQRLVGWDAATLRPVAEAPAGSYVRALGVTRRGQALFVFDQYKGTSFYSLPELNHLPRQDDFVALRVVSPDGGFGLNGYGSAVRLLDLGRRRQGEALTGEFNNQLVGVAFSADGGRFAHAENGGGIALRATDGAGLIGRFSGHAAGGASALAFSPDGSLLASGGGTKRQVQLWEVSTRTLLREWTFGAGIVALTFAGPDRLVALANENNLVSAAFVLNRSEQAWQRIGDPIDGLRRLNALAASPDGRLLALGDTEGRVRLWEVATGKQAVPAKHNQGRVSALALSADGARVVTCDQGDSSGQAILWDVESGRPLARAEGKGGHLRAVALTADGAGYYTGDDSGEITLRDLRTGQRLRQWPAVGSAITALRPLPGGQVAVVLHNGGKFVRWDPATGQLTAELPGFASPGWVDGLASGGEVERFRLAACGTNSANGVFTRQVRVYSSGGELLQSLEERRVGPVTAVAVSPDGARLATGRDRGAVHLWDLDRPAGEPVELVPGGGGKVTALSFFPDGKRLAVAGDDGVAQVRSLTGALVKRWQLPGPVKALAIDRTGEYLVTGNGNGTAYVLRMAGAR